VTTDKSNAVKSSASGKVSIVSLSKLPKGQQKQTGIVKIKRSQIEQVSSSQHEIKRENIKNSTTKLQASQ
jgi:hypothetical protein